MTAAAPPGPHPAPNGYMQRDLVGQRGWIAKQDFLDGVALGQIMPGPLAAQVATWAGHLRCGPLGTVATAAAFIIPSFVVITAVAALYVHYPELPDSELAAIQSLVVGSGLAIVPLLRDGVVAQHHWLTQG